METEQLKLKLQLSEDSIDSLFVFSPNKKRKVDLTNMATSRLERSGDKKVGLKKLLGKQGNTIENMRQKQREHAKKVRRESLYAAMKKGTELSEEESTDEDYNPEDTENSWTSSREESSGDDYTSDEDGEKSIKIEDVVPKSAEALASQVSHDSNAENHFANTYSDEHDSSNNPPDDNGEREKSLRKGMRRSSRLNSKTV